MLPSLLNVVISVNLPEVPEHESDPSIEQVGLKAVEMSHDSTSYRYRNR